MVRLLQLVQNIVTENESFIQWYRLNPQLIKNNS